MNTRIVSIVAKMGPELQFVVDSQDVDALAKDVMGAGDYDSFFVGTSNGDYTEVWGMCGIIPYNSKLVTRLL